MLSDNKSKMNIIKIYDVNGLFKELEVSDLKYIKVDGILVFSV